MSESVKVPTPDPTILTTEALLREIGQLKELIQTENRGAKNVLEARFNSVDKQFEMAERQRVEQKLDTKAAVDAALIAQKEAVKEQTTASEKAISKSEASTTKQLEQQATGFSASISGVSNQLNDVKDRVSEVKQQITLATGTKQGSIDKANSANQIIIAILALITIGSVIMGIVQHLGK